ncbi:WhiB family transcriptional regulator [Nocardia brasiliensis]|uniref:WhiB family transcriptional regulator n=1 Tax=Nocardia brasiliensis TaxID=37326 RepID=UPI003D8C7164
MDRQPSIEQWEWQVHGSCRDTDASVFCSPDGERGQSRAHRVNRAKRICKGCPVRLQCRDFALKTEETYGVWGGMSEEERRKAITRASRQPRATA